MDKQLEFKQIILVTDGKSNSGTDPVLVAKQSIEEGITVSAIGIVGGHNFDGNVDEIKNIAKAGSGIWELTDIDNLESTMCVLTRQTVCNTIQQVINKELVNIIGKKIDEVEIDSRKKIIDLINQVEEEMTLKCYIVLDCSKSMINKMEIAKKSLSRLLNNLNDRKGKTYVGLIAYPFGVEMDFRVITELTDDVKVLRNSMNEIKIGGLTPTGPALAKAVSLLSSKKEGEDHQKGLLESMIV